MTDREALLRAVAANPDEDTPRLVYADLLDELGGEANVARARFIRMQIDLVRNPGRSWFANSDRLCAVAQLAGQFADAWLLAELPKWVADEARKQRLRADDFPRGFLDTFHVKPRAFAAQGNQLLDAAPITRIVASGLTNGADLTAFLVSPFLSRVRSLALPAGNGDLAASIIKTSTVALSVALSAIEELDLSGSGLTDTGAVSLSQTRALTNLRVLVAHKSHLSYVGSRRLLGTIALPKLQTLDIRGTREGYRWVHEIRLRHPGKTVLV
jgi:uncharacterized protein (TIGR02996 family)